VHNRPTLKMVFLLARVWRMIHLHGLLSHNIDIFFFIDRIMSNLD
jgi:hypothetical protein